MIKRAESFIESSTSPASSSQINVGVRHTHIYIKLRLASECCRSLDCSDVTKGDEKEGQKPQNQTALAAGIEKTHRRGGGGRPCGNNYGYGIPRAVHAAGPHPRRSVTTRTKQH